MNLNSNASIHFSLTRLQTCARDEFDMDVLFIFECCFGGVDAMPAIIFTQHSSTKKMETIAAGEGKIWVGTPLDFSRRFAEALDSNKDARTVEEIFSGIKSEVGTDREYPTAPGSYRRDCGQQSIVLQPLKR